jgi:hypothetical protein
MFIAIVLNFIQNMYKKEIHIRIRTSKKIQVTKKITEQESNRTY